MAVLHPIKVVIDNWPEDKVEEIQTSVHPKKPELGKRTVYFSKEVYIDASDFMENPDADFFRLSPGKEVRLRNAYVIKCKDAKKDASGKIVELHCDYDAATLGGKPTSDGRKVKGVIHWVSAAKCVDAEVRIYGRLFNVPDPENVPEGKDFKINLNPESLKVIKNAKLEWSLKDASVANRYQFERVGYFCVDSKDSKPDALVFNMTVELPSSH
jgi:glutaminyl-tRNA synthetase